MKRRKVPSLVSPRTVLRVLVIAALAVFMAAPMSASLSDATAEAATIDDSSHVVDFRNAVVRRGGRAEEEKMEDDGSALTCSTATTTAGAGGKGTTEGATPSMPPSATPPPTTASAPIGGTPQPLDDSTSTTARPAAEAKTDVASPPAEETPKEAAPTPPIATFDEWTKARMQAEQMKAPPLAGGQAPLPTGATNGGGVGGNGGHASLPGDASVPVAVPTTNGGTATAGGQPNGVEQAAAVKFRAASALAANRNYASKECGAKVVYANEEAENAGALLNDKERDSYMRNPCEKAANKQVVIELCETIQPRTLEIANFELFSSGPNLVRFSAAERNAPTQEWTVLGEWALSETQRVVQRLEVPAETRAYAKFIKVDLLSHHGKEHYCTLSMIRVLGVSMVDEYEAEAMAADRLPPPVVVATPVQTPSPVQTPPPLPVTTLPPSPPVVEEEKKIDSPPSPVVATNGSVSVSSSPPPPSEAKAAEGFGGSILQKIIEVVKGEKKVEEEKKEDAPRHEGKRKGSRFAPLFACDVCPAINASTSKSAAPFDFCPAALLFCTGRHAADIGHSAAAKSSSSPPSSTVATSSSSPSAADRERARRARMATLQRAGFAPLGGCDDRKDGGGGGETPLPPTQLPPPPTVGHQGQQRKATSVAETVVLAKEDKAAGDEKHDPSKSVPPSPVHSQQQSTDGPVPTLPSPSVPQQHIPAPSTTMTTPPVAQQQQTVTLFDGLPAPTMPHKESVFLKLNKRIAALELNMSLSSEYLSELSRQYIAHTDSQKRAMEATRSAAERAAADAARMVNETVRDQLFSLRKEMDSLSAWLANLRAQAGGVALVSRRLPPLPPLRVDDDDECDIQDGEEEEEQMESLQHRGHPSCPRIEHATTRRVHGPERRPEDSKGTATGEEMDPSMVRDMRHFSHHYDGIWTTDQVLYAVLGAQALTVLLVLAFQSCYAYIARGHYAVDTSDRAQGPLIASPERAQSPAVDTETIERLVEAKFLSLHRAAEEARRLPIPIPSDPISPTTGGGTEGGPPSTSSSVTSSTRKREQRRRRSRRERDEEAPTAAHCRQCGGPSPDWDSAMDSSLPSPSQTGSEDEATTPSSLALGPQPSSDADTPSVEEIPVLA